ncbi:MAG: hypothetical protein IJ086_01260 [Clostridium sp.]|nr:hypothetical protein [Clostridium sp.]
MEISRASDSMAYIKPEFRGRKKALEQNRKVKRKEKFLNLLSLLKKYGCYIMLFTIIVLLSYILVDINQEKNLIMYLEQDINIPSSIVKKVIDYLN